MRGPADVPKHLKATYDSLTEDQQRHLLERALLAMPSLAGAPPCQHDTLNWTIHPEGGILDTGWIVYLDGSYGMGPASCWGGLASG